MHSCDVCGKPAGYRRKVFDPRRGEYGEYHFCDTPCEAVKIDQLEIQAYTFKLVRTANGS